MSNPLADLGELVLENAEVCAKQLLEEDSLARDIPFVSNALKLMRSISSISDRILGHKLKKLFDSLHRVPERELNQMYQGLLSKPEDARRIGELTLLTVERVADLEKPSWVALMLLGYIDGVVTYDEFRRVCTAVNQTIPTDLAYLVDVADQPPSKELSALAALVPSGLATVKGEATWNEDGVLLYAASDLGRKVARVHTKWGHILD